MILNLDNYEIEGIVLGNNTGMSEGNNYRGPLFINVKDGVIKYISVRLNNFYSKGEIFKGKLEINSELINLDDSVQPGTICPLITKQIDHWDDDVEVNYQFKKDSVELEFSWHWENGSLVANYVGLELG